VRGRRISTLRCASPSNAWEKPIYEEVATLVEVTFDANDNHNECDAELSEEHIADPLTNNVGDQ
jgi:hypothetical protein